jgi:hypothetical protein
LAYSNLQNMETLIILIDFFILALVLAGIFGFYCACFRLRSAIRANLRDDNYGDIVADPCMRRPPDQPQSEMSRRTNNPNAQLNETELMEITIENTRN